MIDILATVAPNLMLWKNTTHNLGSPLCQPLRGLWEMKPEEPGHITAPTDPGTALLGGPSDGGEDHLAEFDAETPSRPE